jgi:hypothetical protein
MRSYCCSIAIRDWLDDDRAVEISRRPHSYKASAKALMGRPTTRFAISIICGLPEKAMKS